MFNEAEDKEGDDRADVDHTERWNDPAEDVEVGVGIEGDEHHDTRTLKFGKPGAEDANDQEDGVGEEQFIDNKK